MLGVIANNLANANTPGFKASRATFATQTPQTQSLGSAPSGSSGGTNPVQLGNGVQTVGISADFSQGSIAIEGGTTSLALQGDGFFILEGAEGEQLFSRNGQFSFNARSELVSADGNRVLGFAADEDFQIDTSQLAPLTVNRGLQAGGEDGAAASLVGFSVDADGRIMGRFSDGMPRALGQISVASFANPSGLEQRGDNLYAAGVNSGMAVQGSPADAGAATIVSGGTELSNTDLGGELIELFKTAQLFRANLSLLAQQDDLFDELTNLARPK